MPSIFGRAVVVVKTNKSGGALAKGDVVVVDSTNDNAVTTTTTGGTTVTTGVVIEENGIANNASGRVQFGGHVGLVNVNASVTRGNYASTHTVAKQATDGGASRVVGSFGVFTTGGTTPEADLFAQPDASSAAGSVATDAIWDAKGDLAGGTGANTAAKLTVGTNGYVLKAASGETTGLKWVIAPSSVEARASGALALTTSEQDIAGCTISATPAVAETWLVIGIFDVAVNTVGTGFALGRLDLDGVIQTGEAHQLTSIKERITVAQTWTFAASAAAHTVKLRALKSVNDGSIEMSATHTKITLVRLP